MYIAQRPDSINVCGEINRVAAMADGLLLLISAIVRIGNLKSIGLFVQIKCRGDFQKMI
jgi:hypothetical protein